MSCIAHPITHGCLLRGRLGRQVDSRDVPHMLELQIDPAFDVDKQPWYTGTVENAKEFWGAAGPPPLPDDVPEIVKLALGDRINRPINVEIAISWVLATGVSKLGQEQTGRAATYPRTKM